MDLFDRTSPTYCVTSPYLPSTSRYSPQIAYSPQASADDALQTTRRLAWDRQIEPLPLRPYDGRRPLGPYRAFEPHIFSPMVQQRKDDGRFPLRMPESIYTAVIVGWLNVRVKSGDCFIAGVMFGPLVLALAISCAVQATLASYLLASVRDETGENLAPSCDGTSPPLRMAALLLYLCAIVSEIFETRDMHAWLSMFPTCARHEFLLVARGKDERDGDSRAGRYTTQVPRSGITERARAACYVGVLLPKVLLAALVLCAGSGVVLRSTSDFDLVLNSIAAAFVLEIDELVYKALVAPTVKQRCIAPAFAAPAAHHTHRDSNAYGGYRRAEFHAFLHTYVVLALVLAFGLAQNAYWCGVSPLALLDATAGVVFATLQALQLPMVLAGAAACVVLVAAACFCCASPARDGAVPETAPDEDDEERKPDDVRSLV